MPFYVFPSGLALEMDDAPRDPDARKVSKREFEGARQQHAANRLRKMLAPGDTVYTLTAEVSRTGTTRHVRVFIPYNDERTGKPAIAGVTFDVAHAAGLAFNRDKGTLVFGGGGYSAEFEAVYRLGNALWPNGTPEPHGSRNGEPDSSGGYALKQQSL